MKRLAVILTLCAAASAQTLVTVSDTLRTQTGAPWTGSIEISNPPVTCGSITVPASVTTITPVFGVVNLRLYALGACGSGYSYAVRYITSAGSPYTLYWRIPASPTTTTIAAIQSGGAVYGGAALPMAQITMPSGWAAGTPMLGSSDGVNWAWLAGGSGGSMVYPGVGIAKSTGSAWDTSLSVGTTTGTLAAGDDSRFTNARTPTAHASTHQNGGSDEVATATPGANAIPKAGSGGTLASGWIPTPQSIAYTNYSCSAFWGDSLIAGNEGNLTTGTTPDGFLKMTGITAYNGGVGGQTSTQIATRVASGSTYWPCFTFLEGGRNNYTSGATVQADFATMVGYLPTPSRYMVMGVMNGDYSAEVSGQTNYSTIVALNSALSSTYGNRFFDMRAFVNGQYNASDPVDVINHTQDVPPSTLRAIYATGTLNGAIADTVTCSIALTVGSGTLTASNILKVDSEEIYVSAISGGNSITACTRGFGGTTAATHLTGATWSNIDQLHLNQYGYWLIAKQLATLAATQDPGVKILPNLFGQGYKFTQDGTHAVKDFVSSGDGNWNQVNSSGLLCATDASCQIGFQGNYRPSNIYVQNAVNSTWLSVCNSTQTACSGFTRAGDASVQMTTNLIWSPDGQANIGEASNYRPNYVYAKTGMTVGGVAVALTGTDINTSNRVTGINGTAVSTLATGILKNTTGTGVPSIAVPADFPTLNQSTTGNAATATALAAQGAQCSAGQAPLGVSAAGAANNCTTYLQAANNLSDVAAAATARSNLYIPLTWSPAFWQNALNFGGSAGQWTPTQAITLDRLELVLSTNAAGCSTNAVVAVVDSSNSNAILASVTIANGTQIYDTGSTSLAVAVTAGHVLRFRTTTADSGCTTAGNIGAATVTYH